MQNLPVKQHSDGKCSTFPQTTAIPAVCEKHVNRLLTIQLQLIALPTFSYLIKLQIYKLF
jgi:hypothetical protein